MEYKLIVLAGFTNRLEESRYDPQKLVDRATFPHVLAPTPIMIMLRCILKNDLVRRHLKDNSEEEYFRAALPDAVPKMSIFKAHVHPGQALGFLGYYRLCRRSIQSLSLTITMQYWERPSTRS